MKNSSLAVSPKRDQKVIELTEIDCDGVIVLAHSMDMK